MLITFDPNMSPSVIPVLPLCAEKIATLISGAEVATATMTKPAASSTMPVIFENFMIEFIAKVALFTSMAMNIPRRTKSMINSLNSYHNNGTRNAVITDMTNTKMIFKVSPIRAIFLVVT